jgi:hypothetical protein
MIIKLFPFITEERIEASVSGDSIKINGEKFDFSKVPEGYRLPVSAIESPWFSATDHVERADGEIYFCLKLPCSWSSPQSILSPVEPLVLAVKRGKVKFPSTEALKGD